MNKNDFIEVVKRLEFDTRHEIFKDEDGTQLYIYRPSTVSRRFRSYDIGKNFQIWMKTENKEFRPNHLRLLIDLNLRVRSRLDLKKKLLLCFDSIFYGTDPDKSSAELRNEQFDHYLNSIKIMSNMSQAFFVEQEYAYNKESRYSPPSLFLLGWIRQFIDSPKEIDILTMSVANRQPPDGKYVNKENPKNKNYSDKLEPLWYL